MERKQINPFTRTSSDKLELCVGRDAHISDIVSYIREGQDGEAPNLLIRGERGVGKTFALKIIEKECESSGLLPVRITLSTSSARDVLDFMWNMWLRALQSFKAFGVKSEDEEVWLNKLELTLTGTSCSRTEVPLGLSLIQLERENTGSSNLITYKDTFKDDIKYFKRLIEYTAKRCGYNYVDRKLLFLIDEAQLIYENIAVLELIREILEDEEFSCGFVFAGNHNNRISTWEEVFGHTHRYFTEYDFELFENEAIVKRFLEVTLLESGWKREELEKDIYRIDSIATNLYSITGGQQSEVNEYARIMYAEYMRSQNNQLKFNRKVRDTIYHNLKGRDEFDHSSVEYIKGLQRKELIVLRMLASCQRQKLESIYLMGRHLCDEDDALTREWFERFCSELIEREIILIYGRKGVIKTGHRTEEKIGYLSTEEIDVMSHPFYFYLNGDQKARVLVKFEENGGLKLNVLPVRYYFIKEILDKLTRDEIINQEIYMITHKFSEGEEPDETFLNPAFFVKSVNEKKDVLKDAPEVIVRRIISFFRDADEAKNGLSCIQIRLKNIKKKHTLYTNFYSRLQSTGKLYRWVKNERVFNRVIDSVNGISDSEIELDIDVIDVPQPKMKSLYDMLMLNGSKGQLAQLIEYCEEELRAQYFNSEGEPMKMAKDIYNLFERNISIPPVVLNNAAFVLIGNGDFDKAREIIEEIIYSSRSVGYNKALFKYNGAILDFCEGYEEKALETFNSLIASDIDDKEEEIMAAMHIIQKTENGPEVIQVRDLCISEAVSKTLSGLN